MKSILVAEDEIYIRENLADLFRDHDYEVTTAADGEQAKELLSKSRFDLVCLDIRMPKLTGMELVAMMRDSIESPIVVITGNPDEIDPNIEAQVDGYIHKPYKDDDVMHIIESLLLD